LRSLLSCFSPGTMRLATFFGAGVLAHPINMVCNDPRFGEGTQIMHTYVIPNQFSKDIVVTADMTTFDHGDQIKLTVTANGTRFLQEPLGTYLAVRALPDEGYASDYGAFSGLSPDLNLTANCSSQVYSNGNFTGTAEMTWTAGPKTYGNVTLSLLWGNGPASTDPLSEKFGLANPFMYLKTLQLQGPPMPDVPPFLKSVAEKCVAPTEGFSIPKAPVFIQTLRAFPAQSLTFPAGQCIPCRGDQRHQCEAATIECPETPGGLPTERLFRTADCTGEPARISALPARHAYCPGPAYHSPDHLDLSRLVKKLQRDHPTYFKDAATAEEAIGEYKKMLYLMQQFPDQIAVPSKLVDLVWHEHILDTNQYKKDCQRLFGRYIHHAPSFSEDPAEKEAMLGDQTTMLELYMQTFGAAPSATIWPTATARGGQPRLPDCCSALCVKPSCTSCVGCNAVNCGKLSERQVTRTAAEHFGGYVPLARRLVSPAGEAGVDYLCSAKPLEGMTLEWTISGDHVYFKHTLESKETWYGMGLTGADPYDMGLADFTVTLFNKNYTGIRDMYKFDGGNNYPCWDVLHQCSGNGTAGTMDLLDRANHREDGVSYSTWNRKLDTGDYKDWPIIRAAQQVLFANGVDDSFTYHRTHADRTVCTMNFFTGEVTCPSSAAQLV